MRSVQITAHVFGLMWHYSRFHFSCSCSQYTCPKTLIASLKLCWLRWKCASISELFLLVTGALALNIRVISLVWLENHLPSAPSDFLAAHFVLRISQSRAVQFLFRFPGLGYLLNLSYYSTILAGNTSVFCHITLPRAWISSVTLRDCFAHAWLL